MGGKGRKSHSSAFSSDPQIPKSSMGILPMFFPSTAVYRVRRTALKLPTHRRIFLPFPVWARTGDKGYSLTGDMGNSYGKRGQGRMALL
jgi:hypothetical protein